MLTIFLGALVYQKFYYKIRFGSRAGKKRAMPGIFQQKIAKDWNEKYGAWRIAYGGTSFFSLYTLYSIRYTM